MIGDQLVYDLMSLLRATIHEDMSAPEEWIGPSPQMGHVLTQFYYYQYEGL